MLAGADGSARSCWGRRASAGLDCFSLSNLNGAGAEPGHARAAVGWFTARIAAVRTACSPLRQCLPAVAAVPPRYCSLLVPDLPVAAFRANLQVSLPLAPECRQAFLCDIAGVARAPCSGRKQPGSNARVASLNNPTFTNIQNSTRIHRRHRRPEPPRQHASQRTPLYKLVSNNKIVTTAIIIPVSASWPHSPPFPSRCRPSSASH